MIKGHPCKVVNFSTAKTGKHGAAKAMVTGIDIFNSNKYECTFSSTESVDAPVCVKKEYTLSYIDDEGFMSLMNESGEIKEDLKIPEDDWLKDVAERAREILEKAERQCIVVVWLNDAKESGYGPGGCSLIMTGTNHNERDVCRRERGLQ